MVHVPIDDQHPLPAGALSMAGGNDHVIHQTEAHPPSSKGMVAGWPHRRKGMAAPSDGMIHGGEHRTGAAENRGPAVPAQDGVEKQRPTTACAHRL